MKQLLFIAAWMLSASVALAQTVIWTGNHAFNWDTESVSADKFAASQIADRLVLTIEATGNPTSWPQVALRDGNWGEIPGAGSIQLSNGTSLLYSGQVEVSYTFTADFLTAIQTKGLMFFGAGYTLYEARLEAGPGAAGYENAVWIGECDATEGWVAQTIPATSFTNAKAGMYLRLCYDDLRPGAMHTLCNGSWGAIAGYDFYQMSGTYYQYTIDDVLANELKTGGVIINGTGYKLTHVDLINPEGVTTLTASVTVTKGWCFEGEKPSITIQVINPYDHEVEAKAELIVKTDKMAAYTQVAKTEMVAEGSTANITLEFDAEPGFYSITPLLNGDAVYTAQAISSGDKVSGFVIGVDPEQIVSAPDMQADFATFWQETKQALRAVEPNYTLTELTDRSSSQRKVYLLEFNSLPDAEGNHAIARAYYAEPVSGGKHRTIVHYQGYDGGTGDPWCLNGNDNPEVCELILSTRGQVINNRPPYENTYGDWFVYGFDSKEHYYYRGAFMDAVRAVDFLAQREAVDLTRLYAEGASQGGALTYAAAALTDHRFAAIAPAIPFLGDFPDYFQLASWPSYPAFNQQKALGMTEEEMYTMLSYFDTKNLATLITPATAVIETIGLQDPVCPPHTNIAPYNNLASGVEKQISYNALLQHTTPGSWWNTMNQFFTDHVAGIEEVCPDVLSGQPTASYSLLGQPVGEGYRGICVKNGRVVMNK